MVVFLSPVGGAGSQFFNDSGVPLAGGKLFTYEAGTSTPLATYTTFNATTYHPNPIVLNAGGRVPNGGEVWLLAQPYKFVLKDSNDVLIATYDNIFGNGAESQLSPQNFVGDGSTVSFTLSTAPASENSTFVYINGVYQQKNTYSLSNATLIFSEAPPYTSSIEVMFN